jgi:hypothetical protein
MPVFAIVGYQLLESFIYPIIDWRLFHGMSIALYSRDLLVFATSITVAVFCQAAIEQRPQNVPGM